MLFCFYNGLLSRRSLSVAMLASLAISVHAVSEEDPNAGPVELPLSLKNAMVLPDVQTKDNTFHYPFEETETQLKSVFGSSMQQPSGALTGKIVYMGAGHGFGSGGTSWGTDRGNNNRVVEDLGNKDQMDFYANYIFNAGGTVVPMRPVGNQTREVIIDDMSSTGFQLFGTWSNSANAPYYGADSDTITYRFAAASASETARARYAPNIPARGYYPVYTWVRPGTDRLQDQLYRIVHSGGVSEVKINHRRVGQGWIYLGTYYLEAGTSAYVEISNKTSGTTSGRYAFADAIRFGNGMGDITIGGVVSGKSREDEGSRFWIQSQMTNTRSRVAGTYTNGNVGAPARMSTYMNREGEGPATDRVYISFHSNAGGGRGADGLWNDTSVANVQNGSKSPYQLELATYLGKEINQDMYAMGTNFMEFLWTSRTRHAWTHPSYAFGEINYLTNPEMDQTIIEVAYHDSTTDAALLRAAKVRNWIARSTLKGTIRYFNQYAGAPLAFLPDPPVAVKAVSNGMGNVTVSWNRAAIASYSGGTPTGYVVYRSTNGYGFGNPVQVSGVNTSSAVITGVPLNQVTYFRVAAINAGGESFPSEVVAVRPTNISNQVLVVNGFDRLDKSQNPTESGVGAGTHDRVKPWKSNSFDYIVQHAKSLHAANRGFDSASNEMVDATLLNDYAAVVWIAGEESTADKTFSAAEQTLVTNFLQNKRALFVSGAELGWDLDSSSGGRSFFRNVLGATYVSDAAGTYNFAAGTGILSGVSAGSYGALALPNETTFPPVSTAPYLADYADILNPTNSATDTIVLRYSGGTYTNTGAAIASSKPDYRTVVMGIPFECITSDAVRDSLMTKSMDFFFELIDTTSGVEEWSVY